MVATVKTSLLGRAGIALFCSMLASPSDAQQFREWNGEVVFPPSEPLPRTRISGLPPGWAGFSFGSGRERRCKVAKVSNYDGHVVDVVFDAGSRDEKDFNSFEVEMYQDDIDFPESGKNRKVQLIIPESVDGTYFAKVGPWDPGVLTIRLPNKPLLSELSRTKAFVVILPDNGVSFAIDMSGSGKALGALQKCRAATKPPSEDELCAEFDDCD